jgi:psp operon transcriptional activator
LSFDVIHVPALSQRREDIPELAQHFAIHMCTELGWELFSGFTPAAMDTLAAYNWPGNVRELKNVVERSLYRWGDPASAVGAVVLNPFNSPYGESSDDETIKKSNPQSSPGIAPDTDAKTVVAFSERVEALEKQLLTEALAINGHNQKRTAQSLGLSYDQLRGLVRKYNLVRGKRRA